MTSEAPSPSPHDPQPHRRTRRYAIGSLVCALIFFCPPLSLVAIVLGTIALRRIQTFGGPRSARGPALAGTFLGGMFLVIGVVGMSWVTQHLDREHRLAMPDHTREFLEAAQSGEEARARATWVATGRPSDEDILSFGEALSQRYGGIQRIGVLSFDTAGWGDHAAALTFTFDGGELTGSAVFRVRGYSLGLTPSLELRELVVNDPDRDPLSLAASP